MTADVMRADLIARAQKVRLVAFDVDGIMTDRPAVLREVLERRGQWRS